MLNNRILFPVDFSVRCLRAAPLVRALAAQLRSEVTLLHVISYPPAWAESGIPFGVAESAVYAPRLDTEPIRVERERMLSEVAAKEFAGNRVFQVVEIGDAALNITEHAERHGFGLIAMPTHGYGRFRRFLVGSVTAKVLHDVHCPVWTDAHTNEINDRAPSPLAHIVCGVDIDPRNVRVMRWAAELAEAADAQMTIAHVVGAPEAYGSEDYNSFRQFLVDTATEELHKLMIQADVRAETWMAGGRIAGTLRRAVELLHADLLVIGRGCLPNPLGRLRTHAYSIVHESPCPVISV